MKELQKSMSLNFLKEESNFRDVCKESHILNTMKGQTSNKIKQVKCCNLTSLFYNIILSLNNLLTSLCSKSSNWHLHYYIIL